MKYFWISFSLFVLYAFNSGQASAKCDTADSTRSFSLTNSQDAAVCGEPQSQASKWACEAASSKIVHGTNYCYWKSDTTSFQETGCSFRKNMQMRIFKPSEYEPARCVTLISCPDFASDTSTGCVITEGGKCFHGYSCATVKGACPASADQCVLDYNSTDSDSLNPYEDGFGDYLCVNPDGSPKPASCKSIGTPGLPSSSGSVDTNGEDSTKASAGAQ